MERPLSPFQEQNPRRLNQMCKATRHHHLREGSFAAAQAAVQAMRDGSFSSTISEAAASQTRSFSMSHFLRWLLSLFREWRVRHRRQILKEDNEIARAEPKEPDTEVLIDIDSFPIPTPDSNIDLPSVDTNNQEGAAKVTAETPATEAGEQSVSREERRRRNREKRQTKALVENEPTASSLRNALAEAKLNSKLNIRDGKKPAFCAPAVPVKKKKRP